MIGGTVSYLALEFLNLSHGRRHNLSHLCRFPPFFVPQTRLFPRVGVCDTLPKPGRWDLNHDFEKDCAELFVWMTDMTQPPS